MEKHLYPYGLIGNCAFQAHIKTDSNIAWMCWPKFDSSFIFGNMLDEENGGKFTVQPVGGIQKSHQFYQENTNVLCTELTGEDGTFRITDFAPRFVQHDRYFKPLMLVRKIEPISGTPKVKICCQPKGDYGKITPKHYFASNHIEYLGLEYNLRLTTTFPVTSILEQKSIVLNETKYLILTYGAPMEAEISSTAEAFLSKTIQYWRSWVKNMNVSNFHQDKVIRSSLALKIHQYEDTGAIVAAGTTSLPESPGSGRNWDYRFCWVRDTYYTLTAFSNIGHFEELERYFHYFLNLAPDKTGRYQPLYSISGDSKLEEIITELPGYQGNGPVRIGNQAYTHIQNDVYGQILVSLLPLYSDKRFINSEKADSLQLIFDILGMIEQLMEEPDAGLWEFRNKQQFHSYTYLFHWAGSNAAKKIGLAFNNKELIQKADHLISKSAQKIEACFDSERGVYTQAIGTPNLDASTLQLIAMNYIDPSSERAKLHLIELEKELKTSEGLFYRYKHADDFGTPETTFLICAFWYVEALAGVGRVDEAIKIFEKLTSYSNHVGLLSEDVHEKSGSQWGNFPQAYSHVGLVNAAFRISNKLDLPSFL